MKKIGIHPLFVLFAIFVLLCGTIKLFAIYFLVVILHELAHFFIAKKLGYKLNKIFLLPYGASLSLKQDFIDNHDEILIAISGPLFNFVMVFICIAFWWIEPSIFSYTEEFVFANFITGSVNLLPCYPLDGGRILVASLSTKISRKKAIKLTLLINYLMTTVLLCLFFYTMFFQMNLTILLIAIFIFVGTFENKFNGKYSHINIPFTHNNWGEKEKIPINQFAVKENIMIYKLASMLDKNKYNLIYIIFKNNKVKILKQEFLEKILLKYPINTKINDIF